MILRNFLLILILGLTFSCNKKNSNPSHLAIIDDLVFLDSIKLTESNGFLSRPSKAILVNDSIIGVESNYSKGIWVINRITGTEVNSILDRTIMDTRLYISGSDWSQFPMVFFLDGIEGAVYQLDLTPGLRDEDKFVQKIKLAIPNELRILAETESFFVKGDDFWVELSSSTTLKSSNEFYKNAGEFLGVFNQRGELSKRALSYPKSLTELNGYLEPSKVYISGRLDENKFLYSFPSEKEIFILDENSNISEEVIEFPNSEYFEFDFPVLEAEASNDMMDNKIKPAPHYFGEIKKENNHLYMQSYMRDNENLDRWYLTTHILKYNLNTKVWTESSKPINYINLGELAGVLNDTLIFVDAGMINKEEKYIKKAVFKSSLSSE